MVDPLEIPDGLDRAAITAMKVDEGEWRVCEDYACLHCGQPAYLNPYTNAIWGCKSCSYTTYSVSVFFREVVAA